MNSDDTTSLIAGGVCAYVGYSAYSLLRALLFEKDVRNETKKGKAAATTYVVTNAGKVSSEELARRASWAASDAASGGRGMVLGGTTIFGSTAIEDVYKDDPGAVASQRVTSEMYPLRMFAGWGGLWGRTLWYPGISMYNAKEKRFEVITEDGSSYPNWGFEPLDAKKLTDGFVEQARIDSAAGVTNWRAFLVLDPSSSRIAPRFSAWRINRGNNGIFKMSRKYGKQESEAITEAIRQYGKRFRASVSPGEHGAAVGVSLKGDMPGATVVADIPVVYADQASNKAFNQAFRAALGAK